MPPRRIQRQGDDEHPASKAAAQKQQQKKKPAQPQKKPNKPPARRPAHGPVVSPGSEAHVPEPAPAPDPERKESPAAPVRKSKRQQREEEELAALAAAAAAQAASSEDDSDYDSDGAEAPMGPTTSAFASLQLESVDDNDSSRPKKSKKKKKKRATDVKVIAAGTSLLEQQPDTPDLEGVDHPLLSKKKPKPKASPHMSVASSSTPPPKAKPKSTEKKKKSRKNKDDDFEAALAELISRSGGSGSGAPSIVHAAPVDSSAHKFCDLLSVSLKDLDAATELKKFFGARVVAAAQSSSPAPGPSRKPAKGVLVQPQPGWPPAGARTGIALAQRQADASDDALRRGERWWQIVYDEGYVADTFRFVEAVKTMDPQNLVDLLYRTPWHADTLLQVSEYYRHRAEHQPASDLVERAIFSYERALAPGPARFAAGRDRLDFHQAESRALFLALSRHVVNLVRRGVARAAFETARFMLALDPWTDPHGALLHLDFLAPKAGQKEWLLRMWDVWPRLRRLPGFWYARVLCLDKEEERKTAMRDAVQMFPEVLPVLADKADVVLPGDILTLPAFRVVLAPTADRTQSLVYLLAHVYADRSADLWKDPRNASLLVSAVQSGAPALAPERAKLRYSDEEEESAYRHVAQFEAKRAWQAFVPPHVRARIGYMWDPLPPTAGGATRYDKHFFRGVQVRGADFDRATILAQLRGVWAQVPQLADMFPDLERFVDMLRDEPEDAMHLLAQARERAEQAAALDDEPHPQRDVEVQFVEGDEDESEEGTIDEEDESDEEEAPRDARPFAMRLMQGLFGRFAPRVEDAEDDDEDSEDDGEEAARGAQPRARPGDVD
ncbi:DUF654-domain-containing protein [Auricularia subglabra TFB-10046 SS5]|nr:DUF654-domain-containing protein [Auricularia subglabra TFB-10046 SS5]